MTPDQQATAELYQSIQLPIRLRILEDLAAYSKSVTDPLVSAGIMLAATRIVSQATRIDREKRRKNG